MESAKNRLYVGNLPYSATEVEMRESFSEVGTVISVRIVTDRQSGRSKGFAFVEMTDEAQAQAVIEKFNGAEYAGKVMNISLARGELRTPASKPFNPNRQRGMARKEGQEPTST